MSTPHSHDYVSRLALKHGLTLLLGRDCASNIAHHIVRQAVAAQARLFGLFKGFDSTVGCVGPASPCEHLIYSASAARQFRSSNLLDIFIQTPGRLGPKRPGLLPCRLEKLGCEQRDISTIRTRFSMCHLGSHQRVQRDNYLWGKQS